LSGNSHPHLKDFQYFPDGIVLALRECMTTSQMLILLKEAKLSPEGLGKRMGISGMTIRRWSKKQPDSMLPPFYDRMFGDVAYQLRTEGRLADEDQSSGLATQQSRTLGVQVAIRKLGIEASSSQGPRGSFGEFVKGISQIGSDPQRQMEVERNWGKIVSFRVMGEGWERRIAVVVAALRSGRVDAMDRLVAYGALFYVVCPFDLIPDNVPFFGLVDEYAVLTLAAEYYTKKYNGLFDEGGMLNVQ
jgi:uncharacterized membrane protein YkvA (DUF1232 family)